MRSGRGWFLVLALALIISGISEWAFNAYLQQILFYIAINIMLASSLNLVNGFCGQFSLGHAGFMAVGAYTSALLSLNFQPFPENLIYFSFPILKSKRVLSLLYFCGAKRIFLIL